MLIPLTNEPRDYAWGSTSLIAGLEGREPSAAPEAEVWFGDHPGDPALTPGGEPLNAVLSAAGEKPLPYLLKLLAAGSPLSIQVHPSRTQAHAGFAREDAAGIAQSAPDRSYKDANHKPELIVALSDRFRALVGIRPVATTLRYVAVLGEHAQLTELTLRLMASDGAVAIRDTLEWILSGHAQFTVDELCRVAGDATSEEFAAELSVLRTVAAAYPGDAGVAVALLMNVVELQRGQAIFTDAGVLHAYVDGLGVEIMAASDNVLRGGLTPKHIDVTELLHIVDPTPGLVEPVLPRNHDGVEYFDPGVGDFQLAHVVAQGDRNLLLDAPAIALCVSGKVQIKVDSSAVSLSPGDAVLATVGESAVGVHGTGELYIAMPGTR